MLYSLFSIEPLKTCFVYTRKEANKHKKGSIEVSSAKKVWKLHWNKNAWEFDLVYFWTLVLSSRKIRVLECLTYKNHNVDENILYVK